MNEKGCTEAEVFRCVEEAVKLIVNFHEALKLKILNLRLEGFNAERGDIYTIDFSFQYPPDENLKNSEWGKVFGKERTYKRLTFDRATSSFVSMTDIA